MEDLMASLMYQMDHLVQFLQLNKAPRQAIKSAKSTCTTFMKERVVGSRSNLMCKTLLSGNVRATLSNMLAR